MFLFPDTWHLKPLIPQSAIQNSFLLWHDLCWSYRQLAWWNIRVRKDHWLWLGSFHSKLLNVILKEAKNLCGSSDYRILRRPQSAGFLRMTATNMVFGWTITKVIPSRSSGLREYTSVLCARAKAWDETPNSSISFGFIGFPFRICGWLPILLIPEGICI